MKNSVEEESSQWAKFQVLHLAGLYAWKERWTKLLLYINSWAISNNLDLEGRWLENLEALGSGEEVWGETSLKEHRIWYLCPRWMLTKEQLHWRKILIRWTRQPLLRMSASLFPQSLLSLPSGLMNKVAMMVETEVEHGLSNTYSARPTWLQSLLSVQQQRRPTLAASYQHSPKVIRHYLLEGWLHCMAFIMERVAAFSY